MNEEKNPAWRKVLVAVIKVLVVAAAAFSLGRFCLITGRKSGPGGALPSLSTWRLRPRRFCSPISIYTAFRWRCWRNSATGSICGRGCGLSSIRSWGAIFPGRVAVVLGKVYMYEKRGIPRVCAVLAPVYENVFAAAGGWAAALACVAALFTERLALWQLAPAAAAVVFLALVIQPPVMRRVLSFVLRRFGKLELEENMIIPPARAAAFGALYVGYCVTPDFFSPFSPARSCT